MWNKIFWELCQEVWITNRCIILTGRGDVNLDAKDVKLWSWEFSVGGEQMMQMCGSLRKRREFWGCAVTFYFWTQEADSAKRKKKKKKQLTITWLRASDKLLPSVCTAAQTSSTEAVGVCVHLKMRLHKVWRQISRNVVLDWHYSTASF